MQYLSPFLLFDLSPPHCHATALEQLSQEIELEFQVYNAYEELNYKGTLTNLSTLRRLLNELKTPYYQELHKKILEHKSLLNFLEFGHSAYFSKRHSFAEDKELMAFVAPFFAYQYSETLLHALKVEDKALIGLLAKQDLPMQLDYSEVYFQAAVQYLHQSLIRFQALMNNPSFGFMSERALARELPDKMIELYNLLPDYFLDARDLVARELLKLAERQLILHHRRDAAMTLLKQAAKLNLSLSIQQHIDEIIAELQQFRWRLPAWGWGIFVILCLFSIYYYFGAFFF